MLLQTLLHSWSLTYVYIYIYISAREEGQEAGGEALVLLYYEVAKEKKGSLALILDS